MGGGKQPNLKSFADTCAGAKHHFDDGSKIFTSVWDEYSSFKTGDYNIVYYLKSNNKVHKYSCANVPECGMPNLGYAYVAENQIPRNVQDYKRHKIIVGQAFTAGSIQVMDVPYYAGNNSCCSQSYIPIFSPNNTKEECLNICKYIRTRFFRYLVSVLKIGQNLGGRVYKLVPTQDFSSNSDIDWSQSVYNIERQLYKKYNLSQEEIDYIEKVIKFMVNLTNTNWVEFYTDKYIEEHNLKKYKLMSSNSINDVHRILDVIRQNEYNTGKNDTSIIVISGLPVEEIREILESLQNGPYIVRLQIVNQRFSDILGKNHYIKLDGEIRITDNI